ncbi:hypothetical protein H7X64_00950 [Armatimonadetes bacterium]|nr:hypothetical protein [bacterium]
MSIEDAFISYDRVVHQSGSASLLALGMAVVLLGIVFGWFYNSLEDITIAAIIAMISIIASFLFIIKQYERSVILDSENTIDKSVLDCVPEFLILKMSWLLISEKR